MPNLNKVMLMGNLTRDPELRYLPSGTAVTQFRLATNRRYRNSSGEMQEEATFVFIDAFGRTAEVLKEHVKKGDPIFVEGRLKFDEWEAKDGSGKRNRLKVICENFQFLTRRSDRDTGDRDTGESARAPQAQPDDAPFDKDENIPF